MYTALALLIGIAIGYLFRAQLGGEVQALHAKIDDLAAQVRAKL